METRKALETRISVRSFTNKPISEEDIHEILKAGMAGPSAVNARPYKFIVVTNRELLDKMSEGNGRAALALKSATLGILVCGDLDKAYVNAKYFYIIDCSIACQNMILAAHDLGIGSVWLGTWPQELKMNAQKEIFKLSDNLIPHSIIAFGYPSVQEDKQKIGYEESKVEFYK